MGSLAPGEGIGSSDDLEEEELLLEGHRNEMIDEIR